MRDKTELVQNVDPSRCRANGVAPGLCHHISKRRRRGGGGGGTGTTTTTVSCLQASSKPCFTGLFQESNEICEMFSLVPATE